MRHILLIIIVFIMTPFSLARSDYGNQQANEFVSSIEKRLVGFVHHTVFNLTYSSYQFGGKRFDPSHGVYVVDCSSYVDHLLRAVTPRAYSSLVNSSGADHPNTAHYYHFFTQLTDKPKRYWDNVSHVKELQAGDILVFRYKNSAHHARGGHVMVVMDKPTRDVDAFQVRVADSASTGHSEDTRPPHTSGIGIGTLLLKVNPKTGKPAAYAWKEGSHWKKNVKFAMARPLEKAHASSKK